MLLNFRSAARSIAVTGAVGILAGCAEKTMTGPGAQEPVRPLTTVEQDVVSASTGFGLALLQNVHAAESAPNVLLSPLSASMALGMALNGAAGTTFNAMRDALGFDGMSEDQINRAYRGLVAQLRARDPKVEFRLANSVWYERTFQVKAPFIQAARDYFDAEVTALDFTSASAPGTISQWAEQQTGGRIRDLVDAIDPLDRMILVNAVYFKAPWTMPFEPNATRNGAFTRADGSEVQVPLMSGDRSYPSFSDDDVQIVELPYADTAFSMVLLAPAAGNTLDVLTAELTAAQWDGWMSELRAQRLMLTVPKFRFEYDIEMNAVLDVMGMGIAFQPRVADFTRIADVDDLHISRVRQKAFIDVHELGTEAAAATSVTISVTSMPPVMRFDRPFLFAIRERSTGTILFVGRVGDPSAS
ncbi:MAG TPA: serpin family protein [Longimicrobiales bacterium]|nr:serpin family protein [Longimicrobiales bacterium]